MKILAKTSGDSLTCEQGEIGQEQQRFYEGTYGCRIFFTDNPQYWDDLTVQAFFSINTDPYPQVYSECDFEYLAYDNNWWWGPGLYETTWEDENNKTIDYQSNIIEGWHILLFQIYNDVVNYYIDGVQVATHNGIYYPESEMSIVFNHWFDTWLGNSSEQREHSMIVDWVYHTKDIEILTNQVESVIASFKMQSIPRLDSMESGIDDMLIPHLSIEVSQNYPNPFNSSTSIKYYLPKSNNIKIQIYNIKGQLVETLVYEYKSAGYHTIEWDAKDICSGIYFYKFTTKDKIFIKKMMLMQ
ncbi:MAG: T9SS type A sorting domain-containing protein [Candidatus Cloacimonetes bacterium]|nr:T9SS type A sorting domain-containing protein [Candidatus Cloacimonadota bacterium]